MLEYKESKQFIMDYRKYLENHGIFHAHVARKIGIAPQQLNNIYNKKELTVNDIIRLCNAIGLKCEIVITRLYEE